MLAGEGPRGKGTEGARIRRKGLGKEIRQISQPTSMYVLSTQRTHEQGVYRSSGNTKTNKNMCKRPLLWNSRSTAQVRIINTIEGMDQGTCPGPGQKKTLDPAENIMRISACELSTKQAQSLCHTARHRVQRSSQGKDMNGTFQGQI